MDELDEIAQAEIQKGWEVFDADGQRIGEADDVHSASFTVDGGMGHLTEVSFTDVESADDGRVTLMLSGDELAAEGIE